MFDFSPKRLIHFCLLVCTLLAFCPEKATAVVRVMPLGDSITFGMGAGAAQIPGGYRDPLAHIYGTNATLVGSDANNTTAYLVTNNQTNNEGHTGYRIDQIQANLTGWQSTANPDVVLLHIGTNDILQSFALGSGGNDTSSAIARLKILINTLYSNKSSVKVVLSTLIPIQDSRDLSVKNFNAFLASSVLPYFQAQGRDIVLVDNYANFVNPDGSWKTALFADYAHPNATGYAAMATTFAAITLPNLPGVIASRSSAVAATGKDSSIATNLIRNGQTSLSGVAASTVFSGFSIVGLNDGIAAGNSTLAYYAVGGLPATITFNLNTTTSPNGYDLTSLQAITGWGDHNLGAQRFQLLLSINRGLFVDYGSFTNADVVNGGNSSFLTTLTGSSGLIARNVTGIRFVFLNPDPSSGNATIGPSQSGSSGGTVIRELQAFGSPSSVVPPSPLVATLATATTAAGEDSALATNLIRSGQSSLGTVTAPTGSISATFPVSGLNDGSVTNSPNYTYYSVTDSSNGATVMPDALTFELNTITNTAGYDITSIQAISGWAGQSLGAQRFQLLLSLNHEDFIDYGVYTNNALVNGGTSSYLTTLARTSGPIATNVTAIRFIFLNPDPSNGNAALGGLQAGSAGGTVIRELQAFGTASTIVAPPSLIHSTATASLQTGEDSAIATNLLRSGQSSLASVVAPIPSLPANFTVDGLNDGSSALTTNSTYYSVTSAANGAVRMPDVVTFNLNTTTNHFGYDLTSLQAITGWGDHNLGAHRFQLLLSRANGPYQDYGTFTHNAVVSGGNSSYLSTLSSASGIVATNVTGIRFIFLNPDSASGAAAVGPTQVVSSGGTVVRELQAFGAASTGSITYSNWAASYNLSGTNAQTGADPDGDTFTNLQEFAFGTDPTVSSSAPLVYMGAAFTTHGQPVLNLIGSSDVRAIFGRRKDYVIAGLTYTVQFSTGLNTWVNSTDTPAVLATDATMEAVSVPFPSPFLPVNAPERRAFFRVVVSSN